MSGAAEQADPRPGTDPRREPAGWYSLPEAAEVLGVRLRDVRAMIRDRQLLAVPRDPAGTLAIPVEVLTAPDGRPGVLPALRGTLMLLSDAGYDDAEAFRWLYTEDAELGSTPVRALLHRRTHAVRRVAQTLAF